jgi:hypothetical protein
VKSAVARDGTDATPLSTSAAARLAAARRGDMRMSILS